MKVVRHIRCTTFFMLSSTKSYSLSFSTESLLKTSSKLPLSSALNTPLELIVLNSVLMVLNTPLIL